MKNTILFLLGFMSFGIVTTVYAGGDDCEERFHRGYPVTLEQCSYSNGGSGYYNITNTGNQRARVCWEIGGRNPGCRTLDPDESAKGSCYDCGNNNHQNGFMLGLRSYEVE